MPFRNLGGDPESRPAAFRRGRGSHRRRLTAWLGGFATGRLCATSRQKLTLPDAKVASHLARIIVKNVIARTQHREPIAINKQWRHKARSGRPLGSGCQVFGTSVKHFQALRPNERLISRQMREQVGYSLGHFGCTVGLGHRSNSYGLSGVRPTHLTADQKNWDAEKFELLCQLNPIVPAA